MIKDFCTWLTAFLSLCPNSKETCAQTILTCAGFRSIFFDFPKGKI